jgi:hypothetical protein
MAGHPSEVYKLNDKRAWYIDWGLAGLIAPLEMSALSLLAFLIFKMAGNQNATTNAVALIFMFPGVILFLPIILKEFHNTWQGYFVLSIAVNWFLYAWLAHWFIVRRRRGATLSKTQGPLG